METLLKHKGFIEMVARDLIRPDESQDIVKEILAAYSKIDSTAEVLVGCSTCENKFKDTFKIILAYLNSEDAIPESPKGQGLTVKVSKDFPEAKIKKKK